MRRVGEVSDLKSLAEMYNSQKFKWLGLMPGAERFVLQQGPFPDFDVSSLTPEQAAIFLGTIATVADNGSRMRTLYVWESDADRHTYIYNDSGRILASYPPPEDYDPYVLSREQIESAGNLPKERMEWLIKSLDPTRVIACVTVADGPLPAPPPLLQPEISPEAPLPGGFGILGGGEGEPALSLTTLSQEPGYDWVLHLNSPGIDTWVPVWRGDDESLPTGGWGAPETTTISTAPDSISKDIPDEDSSDLRLRYYFTPYLDTTYVQAPSSSSLTVKYVSTRNVSPTAYLWTTWADPPGGDRKSVANITPSSITYQSYTAYIYEAQFNNLPPNTEYQYTFEWGSGGQTFRTSVPSTRTWPNAGGVGDFSFIAYGDNRYTDSSTTFNADHRDVACLGILGCPRPEGSGPGPAFVLHTGDLVYDGGHADEWIPHFFRPAGALISRIPVFPCIGNHETNQDPDVTKYRALFNLPSANERWYSFAYGNSYFIVLDTYSSYSSGAQYVWLTTTALPEAAGYDWVFVLFHCPPYTDCTGHHYGDGDVRGVREGLAEPVFENKDGNPLDTVNVVFSGHSHLYERSYRRSVQYLVTGGGGVPDAGMHDPGAGNPYRVYAEWMILWSRLAATTGRRSSQPCSPRAGGGGGTARVSNPRMLGAFPGESRSTRTPGGATVRRSSATAWVRKTMRPQFFRTARIPRTSGSHTTSGNASTFPVPGPSTA